MLHYYGWRCGQAAHNHLSGRDGLVLCFCKLLIALSQKLLKKDNPIAIYLYI